MTNLYRKTGTCLAAAAALLCGPRAAAAGDTAVILSANSGHYLEAYAAFRDAFGQEADLVDASKPGFRLPDDIKYAAAFGARAAALSYPPGTRLVYALAPVSPPGGHWHQVSMAPEPAAALAAYRGLQPGLRRLAVFWSAYPGQAYIEQLREAGDRIGVEIISARLSSPDSIPERLRRLMGGMDAFWLMPDPLLITPNSLRVLTNFACANSVPFYAPTYALAQAGATATYSPEFSDSGAAAAAALAALKAGDRVAHIIYTGSRLRINEGQAVKCHWPLNR